MDDVIDRFVETEGIKFELRAINGDGEVLVRYEDFSADEVASYADLVDQKILQLAIDWENGRIEAEREMEGETQMQEAMDYEYNI